MQSTEERKGNMRLSTVAIACAGLWLVANIAAGQTPEIQKQINDRLDKLRKEQAKKDEATLEELLATALKNNPDIRVAETKLREAEAELYRARINVLNRIVRLQQDLKVARADEDHAAKNFEQIKELMTRGAIAQAEFRDAAGKLQKAKAEVVRVEAEIDLAIGKYHPRAAEWLDESIKLHGQDRGKPMPSYFAPAEVLVVRANVPDPLAEKIRKALDNRYRPKVQGAINGEVALDLLRTGAPGVNIQANVKNLTATADAQLTEDIPLGAWFQWAEDQFNWRFIIRDYGIVVTDRDNVPPGAVPLLEFWRKKPGQGSSAP
jgi:hypothetical protein